MDPPSSKPSTALGVVVACVLAFLPWWAVSNRAAGLLQTYEWRMSRFLSSELKNLGMQEVIFRSERDRFGTLEELAAEGFPVEDIRVGFRSTSGSRITFFGETTGPVGYAVSATVDELPWLRGTVTVTPDEDIAFTSSVDWLEDASRFDAFEITVAATGALMAVLCLLLWKRGPGWRRFFGSLSVLVLAIWLLSFQYRPIIPTFSLNPGVTLGDSTWGWM